MSEIKSQPWVTITLAGVHQLLMYSIHRNKLLAVKQTKLVLGDFDLDRNHNGYSSSFLRVKRRGLEPIVGARKIVNR